jgi:glycosyltransferase involved in cell wall biosynthesis
MHILIIHQAFAALDEAGGTRHHELARNLAARGHHVTIIASPVSYLTGLASGASHQKSIKNKIEPGVTILRAYTYSALHRSFVHRVFSFLSFMISSFFIGIGAKKVDLVWGTSPPIFQGFTSWLLARLKGVPFLFEVRDLWPAFAIGIGVLKNPLLIRMSLWLESFLYRHADIVMVNSPGYIDHVTGKGARKVVLLPNGADPEMFDPKATGDLFRKANHLGNKFVVLYAGAHGMSNDLDTVLEAAKLLADNENIRIVFVGDGKEKPALVQKAEDMKLENVQFHPAVAKGEMKEILAAADACLAILKPLDLYKTTYPNKVFDYMAAGRPVMLAIDGVIRDVVERAGAGIFAKPGDPVALKTAILNLKQSPAKAKQMGKAGRDYVSEHFNRAQISKDLEEILMKMKEVHG